MCGITILSFEGLEKKNLDLFNRYNTVYLSFGAWCKFFIIDRGRTEGDAMQSSCESL